MAYSVDQTSGDLIIGGFQNGIADDPYSGLTDLRNVNIISTPGEASVNFATASTVSSASNGTISSSSGSVLTFSGGTGLKNQMGIILSSSTLSGATNATLFLVGGISGSTFKLYTDYSLSTQVSISGTGTATFTVLTMVQPKHFTKDSIGNYWMIDESGYVWSNTILDGNGNWTPTGNLPPGSATDGNGIAFYQGTSTHGYIFAFHNASIDVMQVTAPYTWNYQWNWLSGGFGTWNAVPSQVLKTTRGTSNSHETNIPPDGHVYFCDANWIGQFFQTAPGTAFDPTSLGTYTPSETQLLPYNDIANCLSFLGTNLMVGGLLNCIYPWDRVSNQFNYPILLAENIVRKMVTVNTSTYCFVGNRGRIYITNGTNAQLWKKVPDYISGTVEPYFQFFGACYQKNQLYFSFSQNANPSFTALTTCGGVWAIDLDTEAMRLANKLSYGTYAGYATAMIPITQTAISGSISNPSSSGTGLYIGWFDGVSTYGIDTTTAIPYTGGQAIVTSELIPIGNFLQPTTPSQVEFKLSTPLLSGESIELQTAAYLGGPFTSQLITTGDGTQLSDNSQRMNIQKQQWLLVKAILTGKSSSPSYNRLMQIRVIGATVLDKVSNQPYSIR